ncbi:hypothetical protein AVEN_208183-1 [Araneus ventricosus]|uniref:Uncharacterized protein n=1 Tax=Araneus ventricosus TaxID=182803 RepID=A0A4Y2IZ83_ARAVE|nr:hypothetical protein AVEN_208183-1 [Araneus ventricosus]
MPTPYGKVIHSLCERLSKVETDEHPDFDKDDNKPEDVLEEIFLIMKERFSEHYLESEGDGDSGNEDVINLELFSSKMAHSVGEQKLC